MKRYLTLFTLLLILTHLSAENQQNDDAARKQRWEDMKAKRAAFYTERICLTTDEAEVFWPIYNELQEKKHKLHRSMNDQFRTAKKDANGKKIIDWAKASDDMINLRLQEATLDKTYHAKFKKIISPEKLFKYYAAERDWANILLKELEKRGKKDN